MLRPVLATSSLRTADGRRRDQGEELVVNVRLDRSPHTATIYNLTNVSKTRVATVSPRTSTHTSSETAATKYAMCLRPSHHSPHVADEDPQGHDPWTRGIGQATRQASSQTSVSDSMASDTGRGMYPGGFATCEEKKGAPKTKPAKKGDWSREGNQSQLEAGMAASHKAYLPKME